MSRGVATKLTALAPPSPSVPASRLSPIRLQVAPGRCRSGQLSVGELVDRYPIHNMAIRQLLIDYPLRRSADTDYSSLAGLSITLVRNFWSAIQKINPGQVDLRISPDTYQEWRQAISVRDEGKPRAGLEDIVIAVRSFYYDLPTWAAD